MTNEEIGEIQRALTALYLEVPKEVADGVRARIEPLLVRCTEAERRLKLEIQQRDDQWALRQQALDRLRTAETLFDALKKENAALLETVEMASTLIKHAVSKDPHSPWCNGVHANGMCEGDVAASSILEQMLKHMRVVHERAVEVKAQSEVLAEKAKPESGRCTVCGSRRIPLDPWAPKTEAGYGACSFTACTDPLRDYYVEHPERRPATRVLKESDKC